MAELAATDVQALVRKMASLPYDQSQALSAIVATQGAQYGVHPLSATQRQLWLQAVLQPGSPVSNVPFAFTVTGQLDPRALKSALDDLVSRHESLRTVIATIGDQPYQIVLPSAALEFSTAKIGPSDLTPLLIEQECVAEATRPFDLAEAPLMRARLLTSDASAGLLLLTLHHIVCDGWSMRILFDELSRCYRSRLTGGEPRLPALTSQFVDYAGWQSGQLEKPEHQRRVRHRADLLTDLPPLLELPTDLPRPAMRDYAGSIERFSWTGGLANSIARFSQEESITPYAILMAAFVATLARYTGRSDIPVATVLANRELPQTELVVGFLANTTVLRSTFAPNQGLRDLAHSLHDQVGEAQDYQDLPFEKLIEALNPPRDPSYDPVAQVMFLLQDTPPAPRLDGVALEPIPVHSGTSKFDISFVIWQTQGDEECGFAGEVEYSTGLFHAQTITRLLGHVRTLLEHGLADPARPVAELSMLTDPEIEQLRAWNHSARPAEPVKDAVELVEQWTRRVPDAPALADAHGVYTYRQLDERANRLSNHLIALGVRPGSVVGVQLPRRAELPITFLAVLKASAVYLPLDPAYPRERLAYMAADAGIDVVITESDLPPPAVEPGIQVLRLDGLAGALAASPPARPPRAVSPEAAAYVIYTSGSTGRPKGTVLTHRGLLNFAMAKIEYYGLRQEDRVLQFASASFDASISEFMLAFSAGAQLCLAAREELLPGPELASTVRRYSITAAILPPAVLAIIGTADLAGVRTLIAAGEACPPEVVTQWAQGRAFYNAYGPTEATIWATAARCHASRRRPPIGRPIRGVEAYVLDAAGGQVPVGVHGELYLGGAAIGRGYIGRPGLTARCFVPDPFSGRAGARLYRTGDIVRRLPDGGFDYLGRSDGQAKIRGHRVELGEIDVQLGQLPGVARGVTIVREEVPGDKRIIAYVQPEGNAMLDPAALRRGLRETLPEFMVPSVVVVLDALPLNANGKVDYRLLPLPSRPVPPARSRSLSTLEREIVDCWRELLGVADIDPHENFFDLGGNSLLLARAQARLSALLGRQIPAQMLFRYPSVHDLTRALSEDTPAQPPDPADGVPIDGRRALLARSRRIGGQR